MMWTPHPRGGVAGFHSESVDHRLEFIAGGGHGATVTADFVGLVSLVGVGLDTNISIGAARLVEFMGFVGFIGTIALVVFVAMLGATFMVVVAACSATSLSPLVRSWTAVGICVRPLGLEREFERLRDLLLVAAHLEIPNGAFNGMGY